MLDINEGQGIAATKKRLRRLRGNLAPQNIVSDANNWKIDLQWNAGVAPVEYYEVYKDGVLVTTTNNEQLEITDVEEGTTYTLTVMGVGKRGFKSTPVSITETTETLSIGTRPR